MVSPVYPKQWNEAAAVLSKAAMALSCCTLLVFVLAPACRPDVANRGCDDDGDCFVGEACVENICETHTGNDLDGDSSVDMTGLDIITDTAADSGDVPDDRTDLPADPAVDPAVDPAIGEDGLTDAPDCSDGDPALDVVVDAGADLDATDVVVADISDTDLTDTTDVDSDSDAGSPSMEPCDGDSYHRVELDLYEPCVAPSLALETSCASETSAYSNGCSSWQREDEPVEVPLRNGIIDESVTAYFLFDENEELELSWTDNHGRGLAAADISLVWTTPARNPAAFEGLGQAATLDGSSSAELTPFPLADAREWTIAMVVRPADLTASDVTLLRMEDDESFSLWVIANHTNIVVGVVFEVDGKVLTLTQVVGWGDIPNDRIDGGLHLAVVGPREELPFVYVNGVHMGPMTATGDGDMLTRLPAFSSVTTHFGGYPGDTFAIGDFDELLFVRRALSGTELTAYLESGAPYDSDLLPFAQPDFDDVRVSKCDRGTGCTPESEVISEVVGVRPFSDDDEALLFLDFDSLDDVPSSDGCGTLNTSVTEGLGRFGYNGDHSLRFDADDTYCDTKLAYEFAGSFTIQGWFYLTGAGNFLFGFENADGGRVLAGQASEGRFVVLVGDDFLSAPPLIDERWYHVAVVRDVAEPSLALFVDGVRVELAEDPGIEALNTDLLPLYLGSPSATVAAPINGFAGGVDDFIVHGRALDAEEIRRRALPRIPMIRFLVSTGPLAVGDPCPADAYPKYRLYWGNSEAQYTAPPACTRECTEGCTGLLSSCRGHLGWWRFDRGYGDIALDHSAFNRHALIPETGVTWTAGIEGAGLAFDGTSAVTLTEPVSFFDFLSGGKHSVAIDVAAAISESAESVFVSHGAALSCRTFAFAHRPDELSFAFEPSGACDVGDAEFTWSPVESLSTDDWRLFGAAFTFGSAKRPSFFIDSEQHPGMDGDTTTELPEAGTEVSFGGNSVSESGYVTGSLDAIRLQADNYDARGTLHHPMTRTDAWSSGRDDTTCYPYSPDVE